MPLPGFALAFGAVLACTLFPTQPSDPRRSDRIGKRASNVSPRQHKKARKGSPSRATPSNARVQNRDRPRAQTPDEPRAPEPNAPVGNLADNSVRRNYDLHNPTSLRPAEVPVSQFSFEPAALAQQNFVVNPATDAASTIGEQNAWNIINSLGRNARQNSEIALGSTPGVVPVNPPVHAPLVPNAAARANEGTVSPNTLPEELNRNAFAVEPVHVRAPRPLVAERAEGAPISVPTVVNQPTVPAPTPPAVSSETALEALETSCASVPQSSSTHPSLCLSFGDTSQESVDRSSRSPSPAPSSSPSRAMPPPAPRQAGPQHESILEEHARTLRDDTDVANVLRANYEPGLQPAQMMTDAQLAQIRSDAALAAQVESFPEVSEPGPSPHVRPASVHARVANSPPTPLTDDERAARRAEATRIADAVFAAGRHPPPPPIFPVGTFDRPECSRRPDWPPPLDEEDDPGAPRVVYNVERTSPAGPSHSGPSLRTLLSQSPLRSSAAVPTRPALAPSPAPPPALARGAPSDSSSPSSGSSDESLSAARPASSVPPPDAALQADLCADEMDSLAHESPQAAMQHFLTKNLPMIRKMFDTFRRHLSSAEYTRLTRLSTSPTGVTPREYPMILQPALELFMSAHAAAVRGLESALHYTLRKSVPPHS